MQTGRARSCLFNAQELQQVLRAMAADLAPWVRSCGSILLIGVLRRGAPLADALGERLVSEQGCAPPLRVDLRVKRYADDLTLLYPDTHLEEDPRQAEKDLAGRHVLVVDDVLYSGHSILKVVEHLARKRPASIRVATLVDRCITRLPIRADVVGVRLQIADGGIVECHVPPYEPEFQIVWVPPGAAS
ncbi:phosphoribosyltransferase family protein [Aquabacterium sp.]|uniref:phosphoribosyltransferase family protein n=1 Tax=Aquabacterium sp. TaxID=1872578 RepID=UPI002E3765C8|nr:phosphoribosyltransferase family protein [Aquabacterium sp.]HEX5312004.1 phosphoribosyltransferase family protein [Aquabacterium sp.]